MGDHPRLGTFPPLRQPSQQAAQHIQSVISVAFRGSILPMFAFAPGRKIACRPARSILEPTRNRTPIPTSRPICFAVDHLLPITLSIEPPPSRNAPGGQRKQQPFPTHGNQVAGCSRDPEGGRPCRCAPHTASPPSASRNSAVCQSGAISFEEVGAGGAIPGAFICSLIGRQPVD